MAESPYKTLAGVLEADLADLGMVFFNHASRHRCQDSECETKRELRAARDHLRDKLAREKANPSPVSQVSVTFLPLPPELA